MTSRFRSRGVLVTVDQDSLSIVLSGTVTVRSVDEVLRQICTKQREMSTLGADAALIVDLSGVDIVRPSGAVGLVCLSSAIMTKRLEYTFAPSSTRLRPPKPDVLAYLARIGFFTVMSAKAKLLGYSHLVSFNDYRYDYTQSKHFQSDAQVDNDAGARAVVWPMQIIGQKSVHDNYRHFEDSCQKLVNNAIDHFGAVFSSPHFRFGTADKHDFLHSMYELYMNVYEHSDSWGVTMIHARPNYGTFVCCYDIGMGFKESLKGSPNVKEFIRSDLDALSWSLVEGHSRKPDGSGQGLKDVERFVSQRQGIFEIRSGACLMQETTASGKWKPYRVPWFPGAQIDLFIPVR